MPGEPGMGVVSDAELQAATFAGLLWTAIDITGGTRRAGPQPWHFPDAYDANWLAALPLLIDASRAPGQADALLDDRAEFDRHAGGWALGVAYASRPRTRVCQHINRDNDEAWYSLAARHLGRMARCERQVVCSVFEARHGDESLGARWDTWYWAVVQMGGAEVWQIGRGLLDDGGQPVQEITTTAGDILLLPKGLPLAARTPPEPGHSVYLTFAIDRDSRP
jgi:hypothetical protein